ncbi:WD40 repeat domain-containing protein [Nocardia sp. IFM 10818]
MTGDLTTGEQTRSPRALFTNRFTELYEAAGNPTLRRVAAAAETRMRAAQGTRPGGASAQRISDWKAGRNVPARFESLLPVVLTLVDLARKSGHPLTRELAEPREWQRLWHAATTWTPEDDDEAACPYLGLNSYRRENRDLFFGRTRPTAELTALVREATGVLVVVGASGAGKSSLLAAGLAPAFAEWEVIAFTPGKHPLQALRDASASTSDPFTPQLDTTTKQLAHPAPTSTSQPADRPQRPTINPEPDSKNSGPPTQRDGAVPERAVAAPPTPTDTALAALSPRPDRPRRLLIIDQFEELFTTCDSERDREDFLTVLDRCATRTDDPIAVVIALRADFYAHCLNYLILQDALEHRSYLLGPMRMDELAQAISGPARAVGLELEPGLEELVITELCGAGDHHGRRTYDPGALPLLSHVMAATWQHREGRRLTTSGYRKAGGVVGSVAETAEYAWNELSPTQQTAAKEILLGLVTAGQDSKDTRRTAQRPELLRRAADPEDATAALELLARTRLVTLDADAVTLTHEIVLTAWPRLRTWIDEDRVGYLVRQRLETDAAEWAAQDRDSSLLYRGTRLQNALENAEPPPVGDLARDFLAASKTARDRTRRRSSRTKLILALLAVVVVSLGFAAYTQTRLAQQQREDKNFAAVLAAADRLRHTDPSLAAQLYLVAQRLRPHDEEVGTRLLRTQDMPLMRANPGHAAEISHLAYRADGVLASIDSANELRLWNVTDPYRPQQLGVPISGVKYVALSPDGSLMATGAYKTDTRIWDVRDPAAPRELGVLAAQDSWGLVQVAFVGDGRTLATMTPTRLTLWNLSNPGQPVPGPPHQFHWAETTSALSPRFAASPDGRLLAAVHADNAGGNLSNHRVELFEIGENTSPKAISRLVGNGASISTLMFSPDSKTLAVGITGDMQRFNTGKGLVELWDIATPVRPRKLGTPLDTGFPYTNSLAFDPSGRVLAVAGSEGVSLWSVVEPESPTLMTNELSVSTSACGDGETAYPCAAFSTAAVFTSDGRTLLAGGGGGEIRSWSLAPSTLTGHAGSMAVPVFDASGDRMATQSADGRITVWDTRNLQTPDRIGEYRLPPGSYRTTLSPDGRALLVITANRTGLALILNLSDPAHIRPLAEWSLPRDRWGEAQISPDWQLLAAIAEDDTLLLWDISDRTRPAPIETGLKFSSPTSPDTDLSFGSDSRTLFAQQWDWASGTECTLVVSQWDLTNPASPRKQGELLRLSGFERPGRVVFSPDQRTMLLINHETVQSWDISDPTRAIALGDPISLHARGVLSLAFTPDARTLMTSDLGGTVQLWDFSDRAAPERIGAPLLEPENSWTVTFHPSGRSAAGSSSSAGAIRLWDLDEQHAVDRICAITGTMWTEERWRRYLPQLPFDPPCN